MQQALVDTLLAHATPASRAVTVVSEATVNAGGETDARYPRERPADSCFVVVDRGRVGWR